MPGIKDDMLPKLDIQPPSDEEVQAAFDAVLAETEQDASSLERLRRLPTAARVAAAFLVSIVIAGGLVAMMGLRTDLGGLDKGPLAAGLIGLVGAALISTTAALRGPHRPGLGLRSWLLAGALIGVPALSPLVPGLWDGRPGYAGWGCLMMGFIATGIGAAAIVVLSRWPGELSRMAFIAASGGLMAFAAQTLFCPCGDLDHQLLQHSSLALLAAVVLIGARRVLIR